MKACVYVTFFKFQYQNQTLESDTSEKNIDRTPIRSPGRSKAREHPKMNRIEGRPEDTMGAEPPTKIKSHELNMHSPNS